jgi:hypothetical protein
MAYSYYNYTGDGTTTQFPVAFPYIRREHVLAAVAGSPATFTFVNSSTIQMDVAPANGAVVRVYRQTPLTAPLVDFTDGATLVAADLDTNAKQSIYTQQELSDSQEEGLANVIPNGDKGNITTSVGGTIWTINNEAVVESKIGTGAVSAAKIAPGAFTDSVSSDSTTTIATPNSVKTAYDLADTANTTANAALPEAGGTMTGVITYDPSQPRLVRGTAVAMTSGTSIDFTGIPSWAKRITVIVNGGSTTVVADEIALRIGDSGGIETTGYINFNSIILISAGVQSSSVTENTAYFGVQWGVDTSNRYIVWNLHNVTGNFWVSTSIMGAKVSAGYFGAGNGAGSKELSGTLDRVQVFATTGGTFDAGTVNIMYEG